MVKTKRCVRSLYTYEARDDGAISKQELQELIKDEAELCLIDVREHWETELGMLPNAKHVPLGQVDAKLSEILNGDNANRVRNRRVVVYCRSGARSQAALDRLEAAGFTNAANYVGSFLDWFPERYYDV
jgi:rhodanese-related sulfurtransferase